MAAAMVIDAQAVTPGEWQCGVWRLAVANGPNIFQMLLVTILIIQIVKLKTKRN